jgi:phosphoenolpyruvate synthase/pyruvate phosphate dikinase
VIADDQAPELVAAGGANEFRDKMSASLLRITRAFHPRPVIYRTYDFRTNEFRGLAGGEEYDAVDAVRSTIASAERRALLEVAVSSAAAGGLSKRPHA